MNATAANLIERVLPPQTGLRQWVLSSPFILGWLKQQVERERAGAVRADHRLSSSSRSATLAPKYAAVTLKPCWPLTPRAS